MELNQQVFKAPAIPKIGKKKVSSSAMRGALKPQAKLRRSSFSFIKPLQKTIDTEKIAGGATATNPSIAANLEETNNILVEIQKQLALDFAYRIAEEKKALAAEKKRISAQKVADKEARIEKGGKNLLGKTFSKVIAPAKSIFQKLIDFFSIILTGILLNTAFKWLSKEENREKLKKFFNFLKDYWQELLIIFGAYKLARLVGKIYKIGRTFKKLFDIFKKKPPKLPCKCPKTSPTTDLCGKMLDCVKKPSKALVGALAAALVAGGFILGQGALDTLKELLGGGLIPAAAATPTPKGPGKNSPLPLFSGEEYSTTENVPITALKSFTGEKIPQQLSGVLSLLQAKYKETGEDQSIMTGLGFLQVKATARNRLNIGGFMGLSGPDLTPQIHFNPKLTPKTNEEAIAAATALFTIANLPATLAPFAAAKRSGGPRVVTTKSASSPGTKTTTGRPRITYEEMQRILDKSGLRVGSSKTTSQKINFEQAIRAEYDALLRRGYSPKQANAQLLQIFKQSDLDAVLAANAFSRGGTVFGQGSGLIDSVKALLAPGEEVIRASAAQLFRPLLKNINDKGGKEWLAFSGGVATLLLNNRIQAELNRDFKKVIVKFTELVEEQIAAERKKKRRRNNNGGNGGYRPQTAINMKKPSVPKRSGGGSDLGVNMMQNIVVNQTPVSVSNNVLQPNINKSGIVVVPITVGDLQAKKQQPKVNVINLPPKTVNLAPKQGSVKTPSSGSATEVPSISPVDAGNPYISFLRLEYGMVM